jgi:putative FmdB family regulatory protein
MPLYEYQCDSCGFRFEVIQRYSDAPVDSCQSCGGPVRKLLSSPAIQFKGSGWYITDYARKGMKGASSESDSTDAKTKADASPVKTEAAPKNPAGSSKSG